MEDSTFVSPVFPKAPLVEVALSAQYRAKPQFCGAHAGEFWRRIPNTYSVVQEQAPLGSIDEVFGSTQMSAIQFHAGHPGSRHWFLTADGQQLVQLQKDRLALNWRRVAPTLSYPGFDKLLVEFEELLATADELFINLGMDRCQINMCEITYINQLFFEKNDKFSDAIGDWLNFTPPNSRSLEMESARISAQYLVQLNDEVPIGRLYVNVSPIVSGTGSQGINLEITCRVRPTSGAKPYIAGLRVAHEKAVTVFQEITSNDAQQKWRGLP